MGRVRLYYPKDSGKCEGVDGNIREANKRSDVSKVARPEGSWVLISFVPHTTHCPYYTRERVLYTHPDQST